VDLKEKVTEALRQSLQPEQIRLEDDDGIFGFVISERFRGVSALDRQALVYDALRKSPVKLSKAELRRVLGIAPLTAIEFESVDHKIPH
jgi:acid stress-induced BolA-like protein IbaG/YrbA